MKTEHVPNGRIIPVFSPRHSRALFLTIAIFAALRVEPALFAQGNPAGSGELISLDFSSAPLGAPPKDLRVLRGKLAVVDKDGTRMLRSSEDAAFLISVPEKIPNHFALEFDLVPKFSGETNTTELSFEGTREVSHSEDSAHVMWSHNKVSVIGGGQAYAGGQIDLPEDLKEEVIGNLTRIRAEFNDSNLIVQTNGRTVFESKTAKFNRGRILRVSLGGTDEEDNAVYLASMRMIALDGGSGASAQMQSGLGDAGGRSSGSGAGSERGAPPITEMRGDQTGSDTSSPPAAQAITGISVSVDASGVATVRWNPLTVAATYQVQRWNVGDPTCCNNMSPPGAPLQSAMWVDGRLPGFGTFAYRVIATTAGGIVMGETQFAFPGTATPPPGVPTPSTAPTMPTVTVPTIAPEPLPTSTTTTAIPTVSTPTIAPGPVTTASSTYMTPGRLAILSPTTGTTAGDSDPIKFGPTPSPDLPTLEESVPAPSDTTGGGTAPTGTVVTAEPAPYSSGPRSVSVMTTEPAPATTTQPEPIAVVTTMEPTFGTGMLSPAPATTDPTLQQPASKDTSGSGGGAPASGRYRVVITGFAVAKAQNDDLLNLDGIGNEVFAAAAVVNWNRSTGQLTSFSTLQTLDYGDVGTGGRFGYRIKAGTGSMNGGIVAGNRVPSEYDITGGALPAPASDRFPLLVWEGTLTAGVESIVVCPSIWEHDSTRVQFDIYKGNWSKASPSALMSSAVIANKSSSASLETVLAPIAQSVVIAPPAPTFTGSPADGYKIAGLTFGPGADRPIGMGLPVIAVLTYQDRFIVVTQENASSLAVGGGVTLALPFAEPMDPFLGALYTLYVRVERTQ